MMQGLEARLGRFFKQGVPDTLNLAQIETIFSTYFEGDEHAALPDINQLEKDLTPLEAQIQTHDNEVIAGAVKDAHPNKHMLLTQTLLWAIETFGIDEIEDKFYVNQKAIALLKNPLVYKIAKEKQHFMVYEINAAVKKRMHDKTTAESLSTYNESVGLFYNHEVGAHEAQADADDKQRKAQALADFFYYIENPLDDENRVRLFEKALAALAHKTKSHDDLVIWLYKLEGEKNWFFLKTVYDYYQENGRILSDLPNHAALVDEIVNVHIPCKKMDSRTNWQKLGMAGGGAFIGIGIAMLAVANLALMAKMSGLAVLGFAAASALVFGGLMGLFFLQAHLNELQTQNRINYFQAKYAKNASSELEPGAKTAMAGVGVEAGLIVVEAMTISGFVLDMIAYEIKGGVYDVTLPGMYFAQAVPLVVPIILGLLALVAAGWVAYCLSSGHYSLDGKETIEYCSERKEQKQMRNLINADASSSSTSKMSFFSNFALKLSPSSKKSSDYQSVNTSPAATTLSFS